MDSALTRTVQRYHRLAADSILECKTVFLVIETLSTLTLSTYTLMERGWVILSLKNIAFISFKSSVCIHSSSLFVCAYATSYIIIIFLIQVFF